MATCVAVCPAPRRDSLAIRMNAPQRAEIATPQRSFLSVAQKSRGAACGPTGYAPRAGFEPARHRTCSSWSRCQSIADHQQARFGHVLDRVAHALPAEPGLLDPAIR